MQINRIGDKIEFNISEQEKDQIGRWSLFQFDLLLTQKVHNDIERKIFITDAANENLILEIYRKHYPKVEADNQLTLF